MEKSAFLLQSGHMRRDQVDSRILRAASPIPPYLFAWLDIDCLRYENLAPLFEKSSPSGLRCIRKIAVRSIQV